MTEAELLKLLENYAKDPWNLRLRVEMRAAMLGTDFNGMPKFRARLAQVLEQLPDRVARHPLEYK